MRRRKNNWLGIIFSDLSFLEVKYTSVGFDDGIHLWMPLSHLQDVQAEDDARSAIPGHAKIKRLATVQASLLSLVSP